MTVNLQTLISRTLKCGLHENFIVFSSSMFLIIKILPGLRGNLMYPIELVRMELLIQHQTCIFYTFRAKMLFLFYLEPEIILIFHNSHVIEMIVYVSTCRADDFHHLDSWYIYKLYRTKLN